MNTTNVDHQDHIVTMPHMVKHKLRERHVALDLLVVHAAAEFIEEGDNDLWLLDFYAKHDLSCHYFVTPSGTIINVVPPLYVAHHARGFNASSIGLTFMVAGVHTWASFTETLRSKWVRDDQFRVGAILAKTLVNWYPQIIHPQADRQRKVTGIKKHSELSPGRKIDPGNMFPWESFMQIVLSPQDERAGA